MNEGDEIRRKTLAAAVAWANHVGDHLVGAAQRDAPILHGALRASGSSEITVIPGVGVDVTVSFDEVYAEVQHEGINFNHPKGGKAKYLEDQLKENLPRYEAALAAALRKAL